MTDEQLIDVFEACREITMRRITTIRSLNNRTDQNTDDLFRAHKHLNQVEGGREILQALEGVTSTKQDAVTRFLDYLMSDRHITIAYRSHDYSEHGYGDGYVYDPLGMEDLHAFVGEYLGEGL